MTDSNQVNLWDLADLTTPWCVHVAVTLGIAEQLTAGKQGIAELAQTVGADQDILQAILGHLVAKGLFLEPEPGRFALNDPAWQLLDPMVRISLDLDGLGGRMAHAWGTLLTLARTGKSGYAAVFGRPFFADLAAHPKIAAEFDALIGPAGHGTPEAHFAISGGWEAVKTVVDVGGGTGAMLVEMLRAYPHLTGTLVDLPETVARAAEVFAATGVTARVGVVGQSFFDPLPPGKDLYLLRGILNDWPDREALAILKRCAAAARAGGGSGGRVVVLKGTIADDAPKDLVIEMVLVGGKQRTVSQIRALAEQAGLEVVAAGQQDSYFVVECHPVS